MSALILEAVVKISVIVAAAAGLEASWLRRKSAAARHLVWTFAAAGVLLLPLLSAVLPKLTLPIRVERMMEVKPGTKVRLKADTTRGNGVRLPPSLKLRRTAEALAEAGQPDLPTSTVLTASYAVGVFLLLIRIMAARWTVGRLRQRATEVRDPDWTRLLRDCAGRIGVQRPVLLLKSREQMMPMAVGIRRPAILIPAVADTWDEERRSAVLLHELAHIARRDCVTQMMAAAACALYWGHPGVWWIARRLRVERELACDDRVLSAGAEAREYAGQLLELAYALGGRRAPALAVSMARRRQIEGRMLAVLDEARNRTVPALACRLAGLAITVAALIPLAAAEAAFVPVSVAAVSPAAAGTATASPPQASSDTQAVAEGRPGTWSIRPSTSGVVQLTLSERSRSFHGFTIAIERLEGLSSPVLESASGGRVQFAIRRDAGILAFEGTVKSGVGAGTYTFSPSSTFPAELTRRGFARPTPTDQYLLARSDIGFAFLDELDAQGYTKPVLPLLVRAAEHGVHLGYLQEMGRLGYRLGQVEKLITMVDHGVSPQYVRDMRAEGLPALSADDLVRARDHGVTPEYVSELRTLGYGQLSLDMLVHARDHGISPAYARELRDLGHRLTLDELTKARDHGVGPEYIRELNALGYQRVPLDGLIRARDHGVSTEYARNLRDLGYRVTLEALSKARDHGVNEEEIRGYKALGYSSLSLDDLIRLREHGVSPDYVRQLKAGGRSNPTVDDLVRLRDQGVPRARSGNDLLRDLSDRFRHSSFHAVIRSWFEAVLR